MLFSTAVRKHCYKYAYHARARGRSAGRAYLLSKRKREMRKNESGEYAGNGSGESAGGARESKRNDWTDNHAKARAGKWLKRE